MLSIDLPARPLAVITEPNLKCIREKMKDRKPFLIKNFDIGPCTDLWTFEYISKKLGDKPVKIHVSGEQKLDFVKRNFLYKTLPFNELVNRISGDVRTKYFINSNELYYLRALGPDPRGKKVADFVRDFPEIAQDVKIPDIFDKEDYFSSIFRVSSAGIQLWTHYDIMDNILIQIRGKKKIILWPPTEANNLYLIGDKSEVIEVEEPDTVKYPNFIKAERYQCFLEKGDIIFIPALWFHNITAAEASIGLNIFWKNLPHEWYEKNDSYGNKDLVAANKAFRLLDSSLKALDDLPRVYKHFYVQRMATVLDEKLKELINKDKDYIDEAQ